jgi:hypothetical protein
MKLPKGRTQHEALRTWRLRLQVTYQAIRTPAINQVSYAPQTRRIRRLGWGRLTSRRRPRTATAPPRHPRLATPTRAAEGPENTPSGRSKWPLRRKKTCAYPKPPKNRILALKENLNFYCFHPLYRNNLTPHQAQRPPASCPSRQQPALPPSSADRTHRSRAAARLLTSRRPRKRRTPEPAAS